MSDAHACHHCGYENAALYPATLITGKGTALVKRAIWYCKNIVRCIERRETKKGEK